MTGNSRWAASHIDEIEALPGPGTLTWHPVRAHFDIRAFGTNAYTAQAAGEDVVEPHTEEAEADELPHEELYLVARGSARFTLDGESFDAPSGTYVFLRDPAVHRHAVALEPGTTVLSFGGPRVFEPSAWEWSFRADAADSPARAREILAEGFQHHPDSASLHYRLARLEAQNGDRAAALGALRKAIERDPERAGDARSDERLAALRGDEEFERLTAPR